MKKLKRGILITVEGIDGCGKTTFIKELANLIKKDFNLVLTKESGGSNLGTYVHHIVQNQPVAVTPKAEYLLFAADRAQHIKEVVEPALKKNKLVISDRMGDSSVVYQGYARGLDIPMINTINVWAMNNIKPDLTFYLKLEPHEAIKRFHHRKQEQQEELTVFEKEKRDFMHKVSNGYDDWFKNQSHVITLDGAQLPIELAQQAQEYIEKWATKDALYE